jgi:hypothetical protein
MFIFRRHSTGKKNLIQNASQPVSHASEGLIREIISSKNVHTVLVLFPAVAGLRREK